MHACMQGALGGNDLEFHRSGWTVNELKKLCFRVRGIGFKFLKAYTVNPRVWGFFFLHIYSFLICFS